MKAPFSVVESRWWTKGNSSVRALFEAIASIHYDNPSAFLYDMFADKSSLSTVLEMRGQDRQTEVVYLGTHGDESKIGPNTSNSISRAEFRNILVAANATGQVKGLYLGTCLTGNAKVAEFLLTETAPSKDTKLEWIAGYRESVDWVDGSAIDMIFFSRLAFFYTKNKSRSKGKHSAKRMAHDAATELVKLVPGAHTAYGFNFYSREGSKLISMFT